LYRCSGTFFTVMANLSATQAYFTVAECMQSFAASGRLGAMMTQGRRWLALETRDQMETIVGSTVDSDGRTVHFPWQLRMARAGTLSSSLQSLAPASSSGASLSIQIEKDATSAQPLPQRLVLPLAAASDAEHSSTFLPSSAHEHLDYLLVPSSQEEQASSSTSSAAATSSCTSSHFGFGGSSSDGSSSGRMSTLSQPLLTGFSSAYEYAAIFSAASRSGTVESIAAPLVRSSVGLAGPDMQALSIEMQQPGGGDLDEMAPCYLIELVPPMRRGQPTSPARRWLALPAPVQDAGSEDLSLVCGYAPLALPLLPPAVDRVVLTETSEATIALTVRKSVPPVGWLLLVGALLTCYSGAPVTDLQTRALPVEGTTFLRSAWRGTCGALSCGLCSLGYRASRHDLLRAFQLRLSRSTAFQLVAAGLAFVLNFGAFNVALVSSAVHLKEGHLCPSAAETLRCCCCDSLRPYAAAKTLSSTSTAA